MDDQPALKNSMCEDYSIMKEHLWWNVKWCEKYKTDYKFSDIKYVCIWTNRKD